MLKSPPSLKKRTAAFFFVTVVLFLSFGGYLVHFFSDQFRQDIATRNEDLAYHIKEHVNVFLEHHVAELQELKLGINQHGLGEFGLMRDELDHINAFHPLIELVQVLDDRGYVLQVSPFNAEYVGIDMSGDPSFQAASKLTGLEDYWSDSFISPRTNHPSVTISLPLDDGVLMANLNLSELSKAVNSSLPSERETIVVTDRRGVVIAHPDQAQVSQAVSFRDLPSIRSALKGKVGSFSETWQGTQGLSSVTTLESSGWVVAVFQSESQAFGIMYSARNTVIATILSLLAVTVGAFLVLQRMGMRPFTKIEQRADMIAAGNYGEDLDAEYEELSGFVNSFNRMARSVKVREEDLRHSEERFKNLFDEAADAVFIMDDSGKVLRVNREAAQSLRYGMEEIVGSKASLFVKDLSDEDVQADMASVKEGHTVILDGHHVRKDGTVFPVETKLTRMSGFVGGGVIAYVRDISVRVLTESSLKKREEQYRLLLLADNAIDVIWTMDTELEYTYVSPSVERFRGYTRQEALALTFDQAVTPESAALVREILGQELEKENDPGSDPDRSRTFEIQFHRKDGSLVWGEVTCAFLRNEKGEITGIQGVTRDISERKKAEKELKDSEERFKTAFMTSPDSININRLKNGTYIAINDGFTDITGWKEEEVIGKSSLEIDIWADPSDRSKLIDGLEQVGQVKNLEADFRMKDGRVVRGLMSASVITLEGEPHVLSITRDISELKEAQSSLVKAYNTLSTVVESSPLGIIRLDREGVITMWNPAAEKIFGWSAEETLGRFLPQVPDEERAAALENLRMSLGGDIVAGVEIERVKKDGSAVPIRFSSVSIATGEGEHEVLAIIEDISEHKKVESELHRSEEKFRAIFDSTPMGIFIYTLTPDDQLIFTDANPAAGRILEVETEQYIGLTIEKAFPPLSETRIPNRFRDVCRTGESWHTSQVDYVDNQIVGAYEVYAFQTEPNTVAVVFMEITSRLEAEKSLRESEEKLRKISEGVQEGVAITVEGVVVEANEQLSRILGWDPREMIGKKVLELVHPDSIELVKEKIGKGEEGQYEHDSVKKDGTVIRTQVKGSQTTYKGRPARVTSVMDITDIRRAEAVLREREKRYRLLYENNPLGYQSLDRNGCYLEVNRAWEELTGYNREEIVGLPFADFVHPDARSVVLEIFPVLLETGSIRVPEIPVVRKDGGTVYVSLVGKASPDEDTGQMRTHCLLQNISEQKQMESALHRSAQLAAVGQVASGIAHEINNPLATISASTEALLARIPDLRKGKNASVIDLYEDYLKMTQEEVERSGKIMRDLLDFARMRDYTLRNVDMTELITSTIKLFSIQSRMEPYEFIVELPGSEGGVPGDRDRLRQVLVILLSNAVESMPDGGKVVVKGALDEKTGEYRFSVSDEGPGFAKDEMENAFVPFYSSKGSKGGTGLGLSIADTIILKHQGRIEIQNRKKGGARVTVILSGKTENISLDG